MAVQSPWAPPHLASGEVVAWCECDQSPDQARKPPHWSRWPWGSRGDRAGSLTPCPSSLPLLRLPPISPRAIQRPPPAAPPFRSVCRSRSVDRWFGIWDPNSGISFGLWTRNEETNPKLGVSICYSGKTFQRTLVFLYFNVVDVQSKGQIQFEQARRN